MEDIEENWSCVAESDKAILIRTSLSLESLCHPEYCSYEDCDLSCDESGYVRYVSKWYKSMKCGSGDESSEELKIGLR